ncbi:hypothetical protein D1AOALGA4SA_2529 [Olavius algarvensis Delta 1 endosymbiont]|nr:hypothetical protein D1AOALGA4SA_2529 [Olavius algarvensis Delta 1 endosymbiont]
MNPKYLSTLFTEPAGRLMVYIAVGMMLLGILVMKRMIKIRV